MGNLTTFLYNYLTVKTSDPKSSVWLPHSLSQYMPVTKNDPMALDTSECKDPIVNTMKTIYSGIVQKATDADKELQKEVFDEVCFLVDRTTKPQPKELVFSVSNVVVNGIENCIISKLDEFTKDDTNGYSMPIPVGGPEYDVQTYKLNPFSITMDCQLEQTVCAYIAAEVSKGNYVLASTLPVDKLLPGNWPMCDLKLNVKLDISLHDELTVKHPISLKAQTSFLHRSVNGKRDLSATLEKILLANDDLTDNINIVVREVETEFSQCEEVIKGFVQDLFGYTDVVDGVIGSVVSTLNQADMLDKMSTQLSKYVNHSFDNVLGEVDGNLPTTAKQEKNAVDQYIFDRVRYALCAPKGKYKLKEVISNWEDPKLDDLQLGDIDLGTVGNQKGISIDKLMLLQVEMTGLSDLKAGINDIGFLPADEEHPQDRATMSPLLNLKIHGGIDLEMEGEKIDGSFTIDVDEAPFDLKCVISGDDLDDVSVVVDTAEIGFIPGTLHVSLTIEGYLREFIESIFNTDGVLGKLVEHLNTCLSSKKSDLSNSVTEKVKQALKNAEA